VLSSRPAVVVVCTAWLEQVSPQSSQRSQRAHHQVSAWSHRAGSQEAQGGRVVRVAARVVTAEPAR
jgi:hypothetical protein